MSSDEPRDLFRDRAEAGRLLAELLVPYAGREDVVVLALPRGGVPVGREIADALAAPLDVLLVRKLGAPFQPELALGAVASGGIRVLNERVLDQVSVQERQLEEVTRRERDELERRERAYRGEREPIAVEGRTVIVVDDGVATGSTLLAAIRSLRERRPARILAAIPVAAADSAARLAEEVDDFVCVRSPETFFGISQWYERFPQVSDDEVRATLAAEPGEDGGE